MVKARPETHRRSARIASRKLQGQKSGDGKALTRAKKEPCQVCTELCRMLSLPLDSEGETQIGAWPDLLSSECKVHPSMLRQFFHEFADVDPNEEVLLEKHSASPSVNIRCRIPLSVDHTYVRAILRSNYHLTKMPSVKSPHGYGKMTHDLWIDIGILSQWISTCEAQHGDACYRSRTATHQPTIHPRLLIDTWRMCLKYASAEDMYVALSYVWGQCKTLKTTNANLEDLLKDQGFSSVTTVNQIPRTIMDAIKLLGTIHERYLWVDCLCIVQDDFGSLQHELNSMASIYANARFTIIAADGKDANHGLRGLRGISEPRDYHQNVVHLSSSHEAVLCPTRLRLHSSWSSRGWVFQEDIFSRRRLVFSGSMVQWECSKFTWREDYQFHYRLQKYVDTNQSATSGRERTRALLSQSWPNFLSYTELVSEYSSRMFTFPGDVLAAFDGLTSTIGCNFDGGFIWGIPEMFFDAALLWRVDVPERRISSTQISRISIPTWSWMALEGPFIDNSWRGGSNYISDLRASHPDHFGTIPILQWFSIERDSGRRRPILSTWRKYFNCRKGDALPQGWEAHMPETSSGNPSHFTSESVPDVVFWYPIPIREQPTTDNIGAPANLIACRTQRAYLVRAVREREKGRYWRSLSHVLLTNQNKWAGALHEDVLDQSSARGTCELIAISAGHESDYHVTRYGARWVTDKVLHSRIVFEYFNVLWIEWKDGIAYRKGIGKVLKDKWEALELEWIDVILG